MQEDSAKSQSSLHEKSSSQWTQNLGIVEEKLREVVQEKICLVISKSQKTRRDKF